MPTLESMTLAAQAAEEKQASNPLALVGQALSSGAPIETVEKLMALHERYEANQARKAFMAAMVQFKMNPPKILKERHVEFGNTKYDYASLPQVCAAVVTALAGYGITHSWLTTQEPGKVRVECVLTHVDGHSEGTGLTAPHDDSGKKNPVQSLGSSVTYLQRYSLLSAVGLAAGGTDDDARSIPAVVPEEIVRDYPMVSEMTDAEIVTAVAEGAAKDRAFSDPTYAKVETPQHVAPLDDPTPSEPGDIAKVMMRARELGLNEDKVRSKMLRWTKMKTRKKMSKGQLRTVYAALPGWEDCK